MPKIACQITDQRIRKCSFTKKTSIVNILNQTNATAPNDLLMQFISQMSTTAHVGDLVVTSGLSTMYPRGILIGKVQSFQLDGTGITKSAVIAPAANFNAIDYVFVLVPGAGQVIP